MSNKEIQALNPHSAIIEDESEDEDYDEENEETAFEMYTTPLDEETCDIDEYVVFKQVLQSMLKQLCYSDNNFS